MALAVMATIYVLSGILARISKKSQDCPGLLLSQLASDPGCVPNNVLLLEGVPVAAPEPVLEVIPVPMAPDEVLSECKDWTCDLLCPSDLLSFSVEILSKKAQELDSERM